MNTHTTASRTLVDLEAEGEKASARNDAETLLILASELDMRNDPKARAIALRYRGLAHYFTGHYAEALEAFGLARTIHEEIGSPAEVALIALNTGNVFLYTGNYPEALETFRHTLELYQELGDRAGVARATVNIGIVYNETGNNSQALEHHQRALKILEELGDRRGAANATGNIGSVYHSTGNYPEALEYYQRAMALFDEIDYRAGVAHVITNIGIIHYDTGNYEKAQEHFERALKLDEEIGERSGLAFVTGNLGSVNSAIGNYAQALVFLRQAVILHDELEERQGAENAVTNIITVLINEQRFEEAIAELSKTETMLFDNPDVAARHCMNKAQILIHQDDLVNARGILLEGLQHTDAAGIKSKVASIHLALRDLAQKQNDFAAYIEHNNEFTRITEEINGKQTAQRMAMMEAEKRIEGERKEREKERALLYGALPKSVADRMIRGEQVTGDHFDHACILFTDIVGFTSHSSLMQPGDVVTMLAAMFAAYDTLCEEHGVMKVKTIGDSYMCFKGDGDAATNASSMAALALALKGACGTWSDGSPIQIRLGIHIGTATAGVIGTQRLQYDVWGDTVNVASRLESTSEPERIHISHAFYEVLSTTTQLQLDASTSDGPKPPKPTFIPRGMTDLKGKGEMNTWFME